MSGGAGVFGGQGQRLVQPIRAGLNGHAHVLGESLGDQLPHGLLRRASVANGRSCVPCWSSAPLGATQYSLAAAATLPPAVQKTPTIVKAKRNVAFRMVKFSSLWVFFVSTPLGYAPSINSSSHANEVFAPWLPYQLTVAIFRDAPLVTSIGTLICPTVAVAPGGRSPWGPVPKQPWRNCS